MDKYDPRKRIALMPDEWLPSNRAASRFRIEGGEINPLPLSNFSPPLVTPNQAIIALGS
ncbi:hypothetical protein AGMMS49574_03230 [Bacteroidia bacterium]|nr:hypothetical protein AGMMS49574_03230 [Bacteroidia bacterium]